jgi:hypothetical protein
MKKTFIWTIVIALMLAGCATRTQTGALVGSGVGAAVGAGVGQAAGRDTRSTLLGAAYRVSWSKTVVLCGRSKGDSTWDRR